MNSIQAVMCVIAVCAVAACGAVGYSVFTDTGQDNGQLVPDIVDPYPVQETETMTVVASGTCGDNLTWSLDDQGLMTISGYGPMSDSSPTPWVSYRADIQSLVFVNDTSGNHGGITRISVGAFESCQNLHGTVEVPYTVANIQRLAFSYTGINTLIIGDKPHHDESSCIIDQTALLGCNSLSAILNYTATVYYCHDPLNVIVTNWRGSIASGAIEWKNILEYEGTRYASREYTEISGTGAIPDNPGWYNDILAELVICEGITRIGVNAFWGTGVQSVSIPDSVESIGDSAFQSCIDLKEVKINPWMSSYHSREGPQLRTLGTNCFAYCTALESITFPHITTWPTHIFDGCTKLKEVNVTGNYFVSVDGVVYGIAIGMPEWWLSLRNLVYYPQGKVPDGGKYTIINDGRTYTDPQSHYQFTIDTYAILNGAFYQAQLDEVIIPDKPQDGPSEWFIDLGAFDYSNITSIHLPIAYLTANSKFYGCRLLEYIHIEGILNREAIPWSDNPFTDRTLRSLNTISLGKAFELTNDELDLFKLHIIGSLYSTPQITNVIIDSQNPSVTVVDDIVYSADMKLVFGTLPQWSGTHINIPSSVQKIGRRAYYDCADVTFSDLPSGLTYIGGSAFCGCTGLSSITVPDGMTYLNSDTFRNCTGLSSIELPESISGMGSGVFSNCTSLVSIVIPQGVTSISFQAFYGCTALTSVTLPSGITRIDDTTFRGCTALSSITLPSELKRIDTGAFMDCTALTSIIIPSKVQTIGNSAFSGCSSLTEVYNQSTLVFTKGATTYGYVAYYATTLVQTPLTLTLQNHDTGTYQTITLKPGEDFTVPTYMKSIKVTESAGEIYVIHSTERWQY